MNRSILLVVLICAILAGPARAQAIKVKENHDYVDATKKVAAKFIGTKGVYLQLGDSITYASPNTVWARNGEGHTDEEKAFLKWSHVNERNDKDGYYLASVDVPTGRSHTAASGVRADEFLKGGKGGLPPLRDIIKKYNPQLVLYMVGTNDVTADRKVEAYIKDVEEAIDLMHANGTVVILSTLPPYRGRPQMLNSYNIALRQLARRKEMPFIDLFNEMVARAGSLLVKNYLSEDGIHLSFRPAIGPATDENLMKCGYLLRSYLSVHKGIEVKSRVFD